MYGEYLKITELTYENRTKKYLIPVLISYGPEFIYHYPKLKKIAFGINDVITTLCSKEYENCIFILFKIDLNFSQFLSWVKQQDYFVHEYAYDSLLFGKYHMVILKFPHIYLESYHYFIQSKYSKMFKKEDIEKFFRNVETKAILKKEENQKEKFKKLIQKEFVFFDYISDTQCEEYDLPWSKNQEIFNYHLIS